MNAVLALCHFCEQHGPSIMFCCEKGGIPSSLQNDGNLDSLVESIPSQDSSTGNSAEPVMSADLSKPCSRQGSLKKSLCQACRSLPDDHRGFVSYDGQAGEVFVSSQHPCDQNVFSKVRQACIRSLSCEVCPGKEGPIFFGDDNDGYVLSYTFFIEDSLARGFKRWYSIIVVMMDRTYLIQSWPFVVESIEKIISSIQNSASCVCNTEKSESQRSMKMKSSFGLKNVTPQNFRSNRSSHSNARALVELTGDKDLYTYLHASFTWIMRACKMRWKETMPFIPPTRERIPHPFDERLDDCHFTSLRHMREVLQPLRFHAILWHLLIGNQVIWFGHKPSVVSAVRILKDVLPKACAKYDEWSQSCAKDLNIIGISNFSSKDDTWTKDFITVEVKRKAGKLENNNLEISISYSCTVPDKGLTLLDKLEVALSNENLSNEVVQQCLLCLKQEWINKTEIFHRFIMDKRTKEETTCLLQDCLQCTDHDIKLMKFWLEACA